MRYTRAPCIRRAKYVSTITSVETTPVHLRIALLVTLVSGTNSRVAQAFQEVQRCQQRWKSLALGWLVDELDPKDSLILGVYGPGKRSLGNSLPAVAVRGQNSLLKPLEFK